MGTSASFNNIYGIHLHPDGGSLWVADGSNHRIRQVSVGGTITTTTQEGICQACEPNSESPGGDATSCTCVADYYRAGVEVVTTATAPYTITWFLEDADEGLSGGSSPDQSCDEICAAQNMACDQTTLDGPIRYNNEAPALLFLEDIISASAYSGLSGSNGYDGTGTTSNECQIVPYFYTYPSWGYGYWIAESREQYACTQTSQCSIKASDIPLSTSYKYQRLCPCYVP